MASHAADLLKEKGNSAFRNGDYTEAEELYSQAIQRFSRNNLYFTNRANARLKLQQWDGAVNDCLKSIEITGHGGQNHKAFYFLGIYNPLPTKTRRSVATINTLSLHSTLTDTTTFSTSTTRSSSPT